MNQFVGLPNDDPGEFQFITTTTGRYEKKDQVLHMIKATSHRVHSGKSTCVKPASLYSEEEAVGGGGNRAEVQGLLWGAEPTIPHKIY